MISHRPTEPLRSQTSQQHPLAPQNALIDVVFLGPAFVFARPLVRPAGRPFTYRQGQFLKRQVRRLRQAIEPVGGQMVEQLVGRFAAHTAISSSRCGSSSSRSQV